MKTAAKMTSASAAAHLAVAMMAGTAFARDVRLAYKGEVSCVIVVSLFIDFRSAGERESYAFAANCLRQTRDKAAGWRARTDRYSLAPAPA